MEMELEIPGGLTDLLQEFTYQVLSEKPDDIVEFAANYFMKLKIKEKRSKDGPKKKSKGVSFHAEENGGDNSDDEDDEGDIGISCAKVYQSSFRSSYLTTKSRNSGRISRTLEAFISLTHCPFCLI